MFYTYYYSHSGKQLLNVSFFTVCCLHYQSAWNPGTALFWRKRSTSRISNTGFRKALFLCWIRSVAISTWMLSSRAFRTRKLQIFSIRACRYARRYSISVTKVSDAIILGYFNTFSKFSAWMCLLICAYVCHHTGSGHHKSRPQSIHMSRHKSSNIWTVL